MTKKTFLPARIVKGTRWYIVYYQIDPLSGERVRFRDKSGLNRIPNLKERLKAAKLLVKDINNKLPTGWPFVNPEPIVHQNTTIEYCVEQALSIKCMSPRKNTHRTYRSIIGIFMDYCRDKKWHTMPIDDFGSRHAKSFMRDIKVQRKIGEVTYNNYLIHLKAIWYEMRNEELYMGDNPWTEVKKLKTGDKQRRIFTQEERGIVARYIRERDDAMYLAILLQYYCFIRPSELRRMKFNNIDPVKGVIILPPSKTKSFKRRVVTIPKPCLAYIRNEKIQQNPKMHYIFGPALKPHPVLQCSPNTMNKRHKKYLQRMLKSGQLENIEGLKFYSWKDTGITEMSDIVSLPALQDQAGHSKPETTMIYYQPSAINKEIQSYDRDMTE